MTVITKPKPDPNTDDDAAKVEVPAPPDGGWGWVVVFASFMVHVIADGMAYSFGVYVEKFVEYFDCSRSELGLLGSIMLGVTWGSGPIASVLTNKFGCKLVTIVGTLIAAFGFLLSVFIAEYKRDNVYLMYLTFGGVAGFGLGLAYLPAIVSVSYYFEKRRALATGLAVCGSGIGTFIFAPLTERLIDKFGWKGTVLIETGILFHCILCGAVMRPLRAKPARKMPVEKLDPDQVELLAITPFEDHNGGTAASHAVEATPLSASAVAVQSASSSDVSKSATGSPTSAPLSAIPPSVTRRLRTTSLSLNENPRKTANMYSSDSCVHKMGKDAEAQIPTPVKIDPPGPLDRKDVFYTRSVEQLAVYQQDPEGFKQSVLCLPAIAEEPESEDTDCGLLKKCGVSRNARRTIGNLMDCRLMLDMVFLMFGISNLLTSIGFCVPYIYLPDRGIQLQFDSESSSYLVSIVGISNTIGRVLFGYIADFKCVNRLMLYNTVLVLCGLTSIISSVCVTYVLMAAYSFSFGLFIGVYTCMTPIVLVDLIGLDRLSNGFGLTLLFQGIGAVIGPPMAGALYDTYKNYDYSFYMMGACVLVSGAMLYPIICIRPQNRNDPDKIKNKKPDPLMPETIEEEEPVLEEKEPVLEVRA